jgi:hypothetical protein
MNEVVMLVWFFVGGEQRAEVYRVVDHALCEQVRPAVVFQMSGDGASNVTAECTDRKIATARLHAHGCQLKSRAGSFVCGAPSGKAA